MILNSLEAADVAQIRAGKVITNSWLYSFASGKLTKLLEVRVRRDGFDYEGEVYKSLRAVAKHITGSHCSGYHFFRLNRKAGDR